MDVELRPGREAGRVSGWLRHRVSRWAGGARVHEFNLTQRIEGSSLLKMGFTRSLPCMVGSFETSYLLSRQLPRGDRAVTR